VADSFALSQARAISDGADGFDDVETAAREEAARAYSVENEKFYVDYISDCLATSVKATEQVRRTWADCWRVFNEDEPSTYAKKAFWQSRIIVPKPYQSVMYGASALKRAFSPESVTIDDMTGPAEQFWLAVMRWATAPGRGNLPGGFTSAATMGLAVGQSLEVIPRWVPGQGLELVRVEPWKIARDPDAPPENPQGGLYWIHTEWLDYHLLLAGEAAGKYVAVARAKNCTGTDQADALMSAEAVAARKQQIFQRSKFRTLIQTREFYGQVIDPQGRLLLPSATMTMAGERIIGPPRVPGYSVLRWPGIGFSPLPDLLGFGGRGLLKGVQRIWEAMNNLMCLHEDALKWLVNPPHEICVDLLDDPQDVVRYPGRDFITKMGPNGQQAVRAVQRRDMTAAVLANIKNYDDFFQRGSMMPDVIAGLPGHRAAVTAREHAQNLSQAQGIYSLMGSNLEAGAVWLLAAIRDTIQTYATLADYRQMAPELVQQLGIDVGLNGKLENLPKFTGRFSVSAITSLMRDAETLDGLLRTWVPLMSQPRSAPYIRPYAVLKGLEKRTNVKDEGILVDDQTAVAIAAAENAAYAQGVHMNDMANKLSGQHAQMDLADRIAAAAMAGGGQPAGAP